jgi:hypothetical protein
VKGITPFHGRLTGSFPDADSGLVDAGDSARLDIGRHGSRHSVEKERELLGVEALDPNTDGGGRGRARHRDDRVEVGVIKRDHDALVRESARQMASSAAAAMPMSPTCTASWP